MLRVLLVGLVLAVGAAVLFVERAELGKHDNPFDWSDKDHKKIAGKLKRDLEQQLGEAPKFHHDKHKDGKTLDVELALFVRKIDAVDEKDRFVHMLVTRWLTWEDAYLTWDPKKFNGIADVLLVPNLAWTPEVSFKGMHSWNSNEPKPVLRVSHTGRLHYLINQALYFQCRSMDFYRFPYDAHTCPLQFSLSAGMSTPELHHPELRLKAMSQKTMKEIDREIKGIPVLKPLTSAGDSNNLTAYWILGDVWTEERHFVETAHHEAHSMLTVWVEFKRADKRWNSLLCLHLAVASLGVFLAFSFRLGSSMRYWLALTSVFFLTFVYGYLLEKLPISSSIPKIVHFYSLCLALGFLGLLETVLLDRVLLRLLTRLSPPPTCMRINAAFLARFVFYRPSRLAPAPKASEDFETDLEENGLLEKDLWGWEDQLRLLDSAIFGLLLIVFVLGAFICLLL